MEMFNLYQPPSISTGNNGQISIGTTTSIPAVHTTYQPSYETRRINETLEQKIAKEIINLQKQIEEKMITVQGVIVNLQRESGKHTDFNDHFYRKVMVTDQSLDEILKSVQSLTEQIAYAKEMIEAIKVSQELSEGFKKDHSKYRNLSNLFNDLNSSNNFNSNHRAYVNLNNTQLQISDQLRTDFEKTLTDSIKNSGGII
ncbi:hypothetical protein D3C76_10680 [compost metagenome]